MRLPGNIVLRPNGFSQPDYSVIYKDPDGRELSVGRIFHDATPWCWTVEFLNAGAEQSRTRGDAIAWTKPRRHGNGAGISADVPINWQRSLRR